MLDLNVMEVIPVTGFTPGNLYRKIPQFVEDIPQGN